MLCGRRENVLSFGKVVSFLLVVTCKCLSLSCQAVQRPTILYISNVGEKLNSTIENVVLLGQSLSLWLRALANIIIHTLASRVRTIFSCTLAFIDINMKYLGFESKFVELKYTRWRVLYCDHVCWPAVWLLCLLLWTIKKRFDPSCDQTNYSPKCTDPWSYTFRSPCLFVVTGIWLYCWRPTRYRRDRPRQLWYCQ